MKSAEEIAKKLFTDIGNCPEFHQDNCSCFGKIEKALTEYAEARVRSSHSATAMIPLVYHEKDLKEARNLALEKAAKAAGEHYEDHCCEDCPCDHWRADTAKKIRALKHPLSEPEKLCIDGERCGEGCGCSASDTKPEEEK